MSGTEQHGLKAKQTTGRKGRNVARRYGMSAEYSIVSLAWSGRFCGMEVEVDVQVSVQLW